MRWILPLPALFVAAFLVAGCGAAGPYAPVNTATEAATLNQPLTRIVFTDMASSDLTLRGGKGTTVEVSRKLQWRGDKKPVYTETWEGQTLRITYRCETFNCSVDYTVELPEGVSVQARTTSGDIDVSGIAAPVDVQTTSGDIKLNGLKDTVNVKSTSGDVSTSDLAGTRADIVATSGDINLGFTSAPQAITVHATSGDITILVPPHDAYRVDVRTTSGDRKVSVDRTESATRKIAVESTSGDVRIGYA